MDRKSRLQWREIQDKRTIGQEEWTDRKTGGQDSPTAAVGRGWWKQSDNLKG